MILATAIALSGLALLFLGAARVHRASRVRLRVEALAGLTPARLGAHTAERALTMAAGAVVAKATVAEPLRGTAVVCWRLAVSRYQRVTHKGHAPTYEDVALFTAGEGRPFYVVDDAGAARVDPADATLYLGGGERLRGTLDELPRAVAALIRARGHAPGAWRTWLDPTVYTVEQVALRDDADVVVAGAPERAPEDDARFLTPGELPAGGVYRTAATGTVLAFRATRRHGLLVSDLGLSMLRHRLDDDMLGSAIGAWGVVAAGFVIALVGLGSIAGHRGPASASYAPPAPVASPLRR